MKNVGPARFVEIEAVRLEPEGGRRAGPDSGGLPEVYSAAGVLLAELALPGVRCCGFSMGPVWPVQPGLW